MAKISLKLKQASAVLQAPPKDLQNLVQFGVVRPKRRAGTCFFDAQALVAAKIALYLKEAVGARSDCLAEYTAALEGRVEEFWRSRPEFVVFRARFSGERLWVELHVPFRKIVQELEGRLERTPLFPDLPPGRKRRGWKKEFLAALRQAAQDIGGPTQGDVFKTTRESRRARKARPEITVAADA